MNVFIHSCHAALEYDHARIFTALGYRVSGRFDVGSKQRPKLEGVTDHNSDPCPGDVIILHQCEHFPEVALDYAQKGFPVVSVLFGQGSAEDHIALAKYMRQTTLIHAAAYSMKEFITYSMNGAPANRLHLIRFGKPLDVYRPDRWVGDIQKVYVPCNSIHRRGLSCAWPIIHRLMDLGIPIQLGGAETENVGGLGEMPWDDMRRAFHAHALYMAVGTIPAPYTLTFIEAACSGTPIIALDSGYGISLEGTGVPLFKTHLEWETHKREETVALLAATIIDLLTSRDKLEAMHRHSVWLADTMFSEQEAIKKWGRLLQEIFDAWDLIKMPCL